MSNRSISTLDRLFLIAIGLTGACTSMAQQHGVDWEFVDQYCIECHNFEDFAGGVSFDTLNPEDVLGDAELWEMAIKKLKGRQMPPTSVEQPEQENIDTFVANLENYIDTESMKHPHPGTVVLHRLNRTEYGNAIRDILGLDVDPSDLLPRDDESEGFDNIASVLKISPSFMDQYINAARQLSILALGNPQANQESAFYPGTSDSILNMHVDGLPLGTRGGMIVDHFFPVDGEYEFSLVDVVGGGYVWGVHDENTMIITIDGKKVFEQKVGGEEDQRAIDVEQAAGFTEINNRFRGIRAQVTAGPHQVGVTYIGRSAAESLEMLHPWVPVAGVSTSVSMLDKGPRILNLEVKGPLSRTGISSTPSRELILTCQPSSLADQQRCAREILGSIADKAFRRKVTDDDLAGAMQFYQQGWEQGGFEVGLQKGIMAILVSPNFLYRVYSPADADPETPYALDDFQLASRLSYFLWSSAPDDELLTLAENGQLGEQTVLQQQVMRMLKDTRARSLVTNFAFQWLNIQGLQQVDPDEDLFPQYTSDLIGAFETELELFVASLFEADESVLRLLDANHSYLNERLALHYGINDIKGGRFRRVEMTEEYRRGLLGKGAVLMTTSYANRTTPVIRGAYIMEKILGTPPPAPPPDVEAFPEIEEGGEALTVRTRLESHRDNPACSGCHNVIDPLGLALENFNAIGQWREKDRDAGIEIDANGQLVDGTPISGVNGLRDALLSKPEMFAQTFTEKLMTYALSRAVEYKDMPTVRRIVREAAEDDYRLSSIIMGIVNSDAFRLDAPEISEFESEQEQNTDSIAGV